MKTSNFQVSFLWQLHGTWKNQARSIPYYNREPAAPTLRYVREDAAPEMLQKEALVFHHYLGAQNMTLHFLQLLNMHNREFTTF